MLISLEVVAYIYIYMFGKLIEFGWRKKHALFTPTERSPISNQMFFNAKFVWIRIAQLPVMR